jgi:hypothetical protein
MESMTIPTPTNRPSGAFDMTKHRNILIFKALAPLVFAVISGCSFEYPVELRGIVRSAKDGAPIAGVEVTLTPNGYDVVFPVVSGPDGTFGVTISMPDISFGSNRPWSVSFKKEGYNEEKVELGSFTEPKSSEPTRIVVAASLRERG